jgi:hypothetical protein
MILPTMELWRHTQRIIDSPVDVVTKGLLKNEEWNDELRYFGIFLILASVLIAMMLN